MKSRAKGASRRRRNPFKVLPSLSQPKTSYEKPCFCCRMSPTYPIDTVPCTASWYTGPPSVSGLITFVLVYDLPILLIVCAYPYVWHKRRERNRIRQSAGIGDHSGPAIVTATVSLNESASVLRGFAIQPLAIQLKSRKPRTRSKSFLVLTLLTCSISICWLPSAIFAKQVLFGLISPSVTRALLPYLYALSNVQFVADPVLFAVTNNCLRSFVGKIFRSYKKN